MSGTRILLVNLPRLLSGVVRGLVAQNDDLRIVGEVSASALDDALAATRADIVALGVEAEQEAMSTALVRRRHPLLRVLMLDVGGHHATMDEPDGRRRQVPELSPAVLLELLRGPMLP